MNQFENYNYENNSFYPAREKKRYGVGVIIIASVLAAVIGTVSGIAAMFAVNYKSITKTENPAPNNISNVSINVEENAESIAQAVAVKASKSVVGIRTTTAVMNFFGGSSEASGEGSGVVYKEDGYIITNYHVIADAVGRANSKIEVFVGDSQSKSYTASVVGYNISTDLAVLKINASGLQAAELGNVDELEVGQYVVTIGAPGGLEFMGSVTYGIISGLDRVVSSNSEVGLIQTDAAINPGNSGGALLDAEGKLVGINSSKIVSEEFEGMGFAIPIDTVVEKCDKIISRENSPEAYIGITISERYTAQALSFYGYPAGAVVSSVADVSPAAKAGIARGDIITEFAGKEITEYSVLSELIHDSEPGQTVTVKIYRSGRYYSTEITIGSDGAQ